jgi:hypothetical protein
MVSTGGHFGSSPATTTGDTYFRYRIWKDIPADAEDSQYNNDIAIRAVAMLGLPTDLVDNLLD